MRTTVTPQLLIWTPQNHKPGFYRTVVAAFKFGPKGTIGVCINRRVRENICPCGLCPNIPLMMGGPKKKGRRYLFLHDRDELARRRDKLFDGVYLSPPEAEEGFYEGNGRMITGYVHWQPGELEKEINKGLWLVAMNPSHEEVFNKDHRTIWKNLVPRHYRFEPSEN